MLSQEEIDALLKGTSTDDSEDNLSLTDDEKDALGEIGNISMGTASTTLFTLLGQKVTITTPRVSETTLDDLSEDYSIPCVAVFIQFKEGIEGFNLLLLKEKDVKIITDLMMGGDGTNLAEELTELHLSAISEAMNQMIGSACTSLSEIFSKKIDILPPQAYSIDFSNQNYDVINLEKDEKVVKISFTMTVGDVIDSEIMQIIPMEYAKQMIEPLLSGSSGTSVKEEMVDISNDNRSQNNNTISNDNFQNQNQVNDNSNNNVTDRKTNTNRTQEQVNVKPLQFHSFDQPEQNASFHNDISLIRDVPLGVTVELGRTVKQISEILDFGPGTVIELDKLVGEPLDILVNGKLIAKGEVVVVDENYGVRITDIVNPQKKLNKI
ncbi:MAG: flagellar motor switch protein FliN [Candidatus Petromonas sp.]|jgi:flagellar motor switch protein FliN/FliY|nr:flagellar motor switch protein FliN [Candidatus Petromonas sp.]